MTSVIITQAQLKQYIQYAPDTGIFTRIRSPYKGRLGIIKTCANSDGYFVICILGQTYLAHRIAWCLLHGEWPKNQLDHINGDRIDNRLVNLREANNLENCRNSGIRITNTSGFKGVGYHKASGKWRAQISINGKRICLGLYITAEEAGKVYEAQAKLHHGAFYCQIN